MGKGFAADLGDLLYYVRQKNENLIHRLNGIVQNVNNLDYIPPVRTPPDIRAAAWEDWERLLNELSVNSSYETVILDLGNGIDETFHLLDRCKIIYMPVLGDTMSACKVAQFENLLRIWDYSHILGKIVKIRPPFHLEGSASENYVEQLVWSELGDYVREVLRNERELK